MAKLFKSFSVVTDSFVLVLVIIIVSWGLTLIPGKWADLLRTLRKSIRRWGVVGRQERQSSS